MERFYGYLSCHKAVNASVLAFEGDLKVNACPPQIRMTANTSFSIGHLACAIFGDNSVSLRSNVMYMVWLFSS